MSSSIGDLMPFGDAGETMLRRAAERYPGLPMEHAVAAFELLPATVQVLENMVQPLTDAGVSPARWRLLGALMFQGGPDGSTVGELARHLGVREPTVTATVRRAEGDGLVKRDRSQVDRRVVTVTITPEGESMVARLLPELAGRVITLVSAMGGPKETRRIAALLDAATGRLEKTQKVQIDQEQHATHR